MVRAVDSFIGCRSARASRTSSAVHEDFFQTISMMRDSSSLRRFFALNIVALQNVAIFVAHVKGQSMRGGYSCERIRQAIVIHRALTLSLVHSLGPPRPL